MSVRDGLLNSVHNQLAIKKSYESQPFFHLSANNISKEMAAPNATKESADNFGASYNKGQLKSIFFAERDCVVCTCPC